MFNKMSCRKCGLELYPNRKCDDCNETIYWICKDCNNIEEHIHLHSHDEKNKVSKVITLEVQKKD